MRQASQKSGQRSSFAGQQSLGSRCASFLRRRYPTRTPENVAADTGLKAETIAKMLQRESDPSGATLALLTAVYGPDFLGAVLPWAPDWLRADMRAAEAAEALADYDRARERLEAVLARP